ncbi:GNAT family N-acetyltransferase [Clostridium sp. D33t1_170424_F3]|uniref:GNAT family N-acetyltransferase n=1 Tax=Clostridium sp. D33t1_170424_F3 TaxID=2787099 RepID=UPI0018AADDB7|nr:GNAT family N-acetyltransferase [Clostridium sp. D33t1_170424_F3]
MSIQIRGFQVGDAEEIVHLIHRNLREVNSRDYPEEEVERLVREHTPGAVRAMAGQGRMFVALLETALVGVLCVLPSWEKEREYWLRTVFVSPELHGKGVGSMLVNAGEAYALEVGAVTLRLCASQTAHGFYQKLG